VVVIVVMVIIVVIGLAVSVMVMGYRFDFLSSFPKPFRGFREALSRLSGYLEHRSFLV
jgi:hypothetical protein